MKKKIIIAIVIFVIIFITDFLLAMFTNFGFAGWSVRSLNKFMVGTIKQ